MEKPVVAVIDAGYESYHYEKDLLENNGYKLKIYDGDEENEDDKILFAREAVGLFIRGTEINDRFLAQCPHLKAIVRYGVGYDNIDLIAASKSNVKIAIVKGYGSHSVSDHALALMYACARSIPKGQKLIASDFGKPPVKRIFEFHQKTLGIIGLGRIGSLLAQKSKNLFKKILAYDPYIPDDNFIKSGVEKSGFINLLNQSDVISIHCNLTEETTKMINYNAFDQMHQHPIVINTARGPVIHEDDLLKAVSEGKIHSAGIDVYQQEPPTENQKKLLNNPNIIATGHYAWYSESSHVELQQRAAKNLLSLLNNEVIEDWINR